MPNAVLEKLLQKAGIQSTVSSDFCVFAYLCVCVCVCVCAHARGLSCLSPDVSLSWGWQLSDWCSKHHSPRGVTHTCTNTQKPDSEIMSLRVILVLTWALRCLSSNLITRTTNPQHRPKLRVCLCVCVYCPSGD